MSYLSGKIQIKAISSNETVLTGVLTDKITIRGISNNKATVSGTLSLHRISNHMHGIGERETMAIEVNGEDVWRGNELTPTPTSDILIPTPDSAGEQMTLVSESTADNGATATGSLTVEIHYINTQGYEREETITMNGQNEVDTQAIDIRFINDLYTKTVGSNGVAEGHIKIYKKGSIGLVYAMIAAGGNKSLVPHRMIPIGRKLINLSWRCSEAKDKRVAYRIRSTDMHGGLLPGVFCFKDSSYIKGTASGDIHLTDEIPALSIIKITAWSDSSGGEGSCSWSGDLVDE